MKLFLTHSKTNSKPGRQTVLMRPTQTVESAVGVVAEKHLDILFDNGSFFTGGILLQGGAFFSEIESARFEGSGRTWLRLSPGALQWGYQWGYHYVLSNVRTLKSVDVNDLTIDCNWLGQREMVEIRTEDGLHSKIGGISLRANRASVSNCLVTNFGAAHGHNNNQTGGAEVFPLIVRGQKLTRQLDTELIIDGCTVSGFTAINGGYCTAIMMVALDPYTSVDAMVEPASIDERFFYGVVRGCTVKHCMGGIAYGCANAQRLMFSDNRAWKVTTPFNCDTAHTVHNRYVTLEDNRFTWVKDGIHLGAPGWGAPVFRDWEFKSNTLRITNPTKAPLILQGSTDNIQWSATNKVEHGFEWNG